jgi:hypothetical protein
VFLVVGIVQSVERLATGWADRRSNPGRGRDFPSRPERSRGPPSLLYNGYRVFQGGKIAGAWWWSASAEVANGLELYLCLPTVPAYACHGMAFTTVFILMSLVPLSVFTNRQRVTLQNTSFSSVGYWLNVTCHNTECSASLETHVLCKYEMSDHVQEWTVTACSVIISQAISSSLWYSGKTKNVCAFRCNGWCTCWIYCITVVSNSSNLYVFIFMEPSVEE